MTTKKLIIIGCSGLALLVFVVAFIVGTWFMHISKDPEGLWLSADAPMDVKLGETFHLVVEVSNRSTERTLKLDDLDISHDYLRGFVILSVEPEPKSRNIDDFFEISSTRFDLVLEPETEREVVFELRAENVGNFRGGIDQYIGLQFLSTVVQTKVTR